MSGAIGSAARNPNLRSAANPDPFHTGRYLPLGPVNGIGGMNISGPYEPVVGWPDKAHETEWKTGSCRGVYAESPDRIIAVYGGEVPAYDEQGVWGAKIFRDLRFTETNKGRHCHEIIVYNRDGAIIESWDHWLDELHAGDVRDGRPSNLGHVNRIRVNRYDPEGHIWIVGTRNTGVFKFTRDGKTLVMKIDADNVPEEHHPLVYAQDMAFLPNGDVLIAMWNSIMRFTEDGEFVSTFGTPGTGRLEFDGIHGIEVHPETSNLYINDRMNYRIVVTDPDGTFIEEWPGFQGVMTIRLTADGQNMWIGNGLVHKFLRYDMHGHLNRLSTWGTFGIAPGAMWAPHYFETDVEGNLYIAEDYSGRLQKLRPIDDIDPTDPQLIGQLCR